MKIASRSLPAYAAVLCAVVAGVSSLPALPGILRLFPAVFLAAAFALALIAVCLGAMSDKVAGAALIVGLYWAVMTTASLGKVGLFLAASGAWFWLGAPLTIAAGAFAFYLRKE